MKTETQGEHSVKMEGSKIQPIPAIASNHQQLREKQGTDSP